MAPEYEPVDSPDETTVFPYHDLSAPSVADVYRARRTVREHLPRTPLVRSEPLSAEFDADVYLKREDTLPTGAFKVRGGITLVSRLDPEFRDPGLIAASTGNHGQSVAYAGRTFDVPVTIVVPEDANPTKVTAMERLGADVREYGDDFDEARERAEELAAAEGYRYVHSANDPDLVAGVGTAGLEVVEDLPDVDYVFCPVGGGSSASGYCLTVGELTDATVVGAQSEAAPAMYRAWAEDHLDPSDRMETFAEGLATRVPFALTTRLLRERLDDFRLVSEEALRAGVRDLLVDETVVMEGASAAAVAAMRQRSEELRGGTVVLPVSGRNLDAEKLRRILAEGE
ncbi:threonine/serine dehydratase [Halostella sp. JP-L12]|uniref:threonine ammonia-lyase n=1 Tax=Halostella TaxID=1843185 RepID=UPI000EF814E4|nr:MULTISPECIES: threonine/serine dehydratase [Halostella]NHN49137.1 threonine/serine dehydratase [Halostella sp. JP-L12]